MLPRIALCTDTFGTETQNGVGRYLAGLHAWSQTEGYPLTIFSAGDHLTAYPNVENIQALAFAAKFGGTEFYYPLQGRRQEMARSMATLKPDVIHISTPGPIGLSALNIAGEMGAPLAGIYHTDFPAYVERIVHDALEQFVREQRKHDISQSVVGPLWQRAKQELTANSYWWESLLLRQIMRRILRRNRPKIEAALHDGIDRLAGLAQSLVSELIREFYRRSDLVIARSITYQELLTSDIGVPAQKVRLLQSGVDTTLFSPVPTAHDAALRTKLGLPPGSKLVLYVGRVTDEKNVGFLARAWRAFQALDDGRTYFAVVGSGVTPQFMNDAGARVLCPGPLVGQELSAMYRLADVFWTASTTETLGNVILEAQASGTPVIVSDRGAARENIIDGQTGLILPATDPARWAAALHDLLQNDTRRRSFATAAREAMEGRTIASSYRHFWELHEEMISNRPLLARPRLIGNLPVKALAPQPESGIHGDAIFFVSDFHAGHGQATETKARALDALLSRAATKGATLQWGGDFTDTRPEPAAMTAELTLVQSALERHGLTPLSIIPGNHDHEFLEDGTLAARTGVPVEPSMVAVRQGLIMTHGHVAELPGLPRLLKSGLAPDAIIAALAPERLGAELKSAVLQYDVIGLVSHTAEDLGLSGVEDLWRNILPARQRLADVLLAELRRRHLDTDIVMDVIHKIGVSSREEVLLKLCSTLGGWGVVYGHSHEPSVRLGEAVHPITGERRPAIIANSGSFRRQQLPITWLEAEPSTRTISLMAYDPQANEAVLVDQASLGA